MRMPGVLSVVDTVDTFAGSVMSTAGVGDEDLAPITTDRGAMPFDSTSGCTE